MNQALTQEFVIEIHPIDSVNSEPLFPALSAAVTQWEREFPDEDEDDSEVNGYLTQDVGDSADEEDDEAEDSDEDEEEDESFTVEDSSDSTLNLTVTLTPDVLADIKALQAMSMEERLELSVIYGTAPNTFVRKFTISPDVATSLSSGVRQGLALEIEVIADIYLSETLF